MPNFVKNTKTMGRGVFAGKNYYPGDLVEIAPIIFWDEDSDKLVQESDLRFYVFEGRSGSSGPSVLGLGYSSLYNHSEHANVTYKIVPKKNTIVFRARTKIRKGDQLFINYGYDPVYKKKQFESYKANKLAQTIKEEPKLIFKENKMHKIKMFIKNNTLELFAVSLAVVLIILFGMAGNDYRNKLKKESDDCNKLNVRFSDWVETTNDPFYKGVTFVVSRRYITHVEVEILGGNGKLLDFKCSDLKKVSK